MANRVGICLASLGLAATITVQAQTQTPSQLPPTRYIPAEGTLRIVYGSSSWNTSSAQPDGAFIFLRDRKSGKVVKINLDETEPDSAVFSGDFVLNTGAGQQFEPEVYIPDREIRAQDQQIQKFQTLLVSGKIAKKPLIIKQGEKGVRLIDVYDTPAQAEAAQKAYQAELKAKEEQQAQSQAPVRAAPGVPVATPSPQALEAAKKAQQQALLNELALAAARRQTERVRLEQIERQRQEERERKAREANEQERRSRQNEAARLAEQALVHYQNGSFREAEELFRQSVELDPTNNSHYFRYGVTLYRNGKFDEALVVLKLAPPTKDTQLEKSYYLGLIHLRLKEFDSAINSLQPVANAGDPTLSPSALFYIGIVYFTEEKYELARTPFEKVIDTSNDPRLDEQAEAYIEKIALLLQQEKLKGKKFFISGAAGVMYDSNVLLAPDNETSQGRPLDQGDMRLMGTADVEYRPIFTNSTELGVRAMGYYLWSFNSDLSRADPTLINVSVPWTWKGLSLSKGFKGTFKPAYEIVNMDVNEDGAREAVLVSPILGLEGTWVMSQTWFSTYSLEGRVDDSRVTETGVNDSDATRATLRTQQLLILNRSKKEALQLSALGMLNDAKGSERYYTRLEVGATYQRPIAAWEANWSAGLTFYLLDFSKSSANRKDQNLGLSLALQKPMREWWSLGLMGSYNNNASSVDDFRYSRYSVMTTANFQTAL